LDEETLNALILDSLKDPVLVADTDHRIVYMNAAAKAHYGRGEELLGTSLLDCHNERSCETILQVLEALRRGEEERLITDNEKHRIYMRAVRDGGGRVVGYYERYEPPDRGASSETQGDGR
jgi:PAS domain S-box-containing protein